MSFLKELVEERRQWNGGGVIMKPRVQDERVFREQHGQKGEPKLGLKH